MQIDSRRAGTTLTDVIITITVSVLMLTIAAPGLVRARDAYSVRSARDAAAAAIEHARTLAMARGTARVTIDSGTGELRVEAPRGSLAGAPLRVARSYAVAMTVAGVPAGSVDLDYNALGLGVMASRTVRFRRGRNEAGLTVSSYGRVRRW